MILETTSKDQPLSLRTRQQRIMVHRFLADLGMISSGVDTLVGAAAGDGQIRAALYDAGGVGRNGPVALEKDLALMSGIVVRRIGPVEITGGVLDQFDVLIVPGGSGSKQAKAIGTEGCKAIADFVKNGGGFVGFCAGAYLAANNYTWSLKIIDADVIDRKHWKRGTGGVKIELTPEGRKMLNGNCDLIDIRYANGPILQPGEDPDIPDFKPLAFYRTEINKNNAPPGVMKDTPAIIAGQFGAGRVFCSSPHPEYTEGLEPFVHNAVRWASAK
jgi:putative intracellular protease/amidase